MKISLFVFSVFIFTSGYAQKFDGFVITEQDSLFKGYMRFSLEGGNGLKVLITNDKQKKPRSYFVRDLKYYAYKKDTFALLQAFRPFEGEDYMAVGVEAKFIISKGNVKLFKGDFKNYLAPYFVNGVYIEPVYKTYIVKNQDGDLFGIKYEQDEFLESIKVALGDDLELMKQIENKELRYRDIEEIIKIYNKNKSMKRK